MATIHSDYQGPADWDAYSPKHDDGCREDDCPGQCIEHYALSGEPVNVGCPCWCHEDEPDACSEHRAGCPKGAH